MELDRDLEPLLLAPSESAALLRQVVTQTVRRIVQTEQAALARRLDPGAIVMSALLASPGFVGLVLAGHATTGGDGRCWSSLHCG